MGTSKILAENFSIRYITNDIEIIEYKTDFHSCRSVIENVRVSNIVKAVVSMNQQAALRRLYYAMKDAALLDYFILDLRDLTRYEK